MLKPFVQHVRNCVKFKSRLANCKQSFINFPGRTTIVIAHRLSTIRNADKIIAFHEGRKMEEGSHEELLKIPDGVYANLINMQAGREEEDADEETVNQPDDADRPGRSGGFAVVTLTL